MAVHFSPNYESVELQKLSWWFKREYSDAINSRIGYELKLDEYDRQYEQIPKVPYKTFPWPDASNLEVGIGATHTDTIVSRIESAYFGTQPWVIVTELSGKFEAHAMALADYMNQVSLPYSNYREEKAIDLLQSVKLGTSFQQMLYRRQFKNIRMEQVSPSGVTTRRKTSINVHEGPLQFTVHPKNLIFPSDTRNIKNARWLAIRSDKTWGEIVSHVNQQHYERSQVEKIRSSGSMTSRDARQLGRQGLRTGSVRTWEIASVYALYAEEDSFDEPEDIWFDIDIRSGLILRAIYNPYNHQQWPLSRSVYMVRENGFVGLGIMGMLSMIEEEITTIHNYCLDNMLASNTVQILAKQSTIADVKIGPMQVLTYNGNKDDVRFERLGQALSGQQVGEAAAMNLAASRTGVAEGSVGRQSPETGLTSSRTPATTYMAALGESNKRFELAIDNNKRSDSVMLFQHAMLLKQYWQLQRPMAESWDSKKAALLDTLFAQDDDYFRHGLVIQVAASTVMLNKELERQNLMVLSQFMQKFYELFISYLTLMSQFPPLEPVIRKILGGATLFVNRLLHTFDIHDPERFIPSLDELGSAATQRPQETSQLLTNSFLNGAIGTGQNGNGTVQQRG